MNMPLMMMFMVLINMELHLHYQPPAVHASQTLSEKCQKLAQPLKLLYSFNTGHHHHHARAE